MKRVFVTGGSGYLGRHLISALIDQGYYVVAMARSDTSAEAIARLGATAARCNLEDAPSLALALRGCSAVVHAASRFMEAGGYAAFVRDNIEGTNHLLTAAKQARVAQFVYVGAAGCLVGGRPVLGADETWPLQEPSYSPYFRTKSIADRLVRSSATDAFATCVVRPGLIWGGEGDTFTESIVEATRAGKMMFIDGGRHPIMTSHVDNTVRGILCALQRGRAGEAYFVFDDGAVTTHEFLGRLIQARGLKVPDRKIPFAVAWIIASLMEMVWKICGRSDSPPLNRVLVKLNGGPFVISDQKARMEIGYAPVVARDEAIMNIANGTRIAV